MLVYSGARSCGLNYHFVPGTKSTILQSRLDLPLPKFDHSTKKHVPGPSFGKYGPAGRGQTLPNMVELVLSFASIVSYLQGLLLDWI